VMGLSVNALDILGGTMLGIGFLGGNDSNLWTVVEPTFDQSPTRVFSHTKASA
jgi:hypothetical protein